LLFHLNAHTSSGTGKSVLLKEIIRLLQPRGGLAITAPTGIASLNIGGRTIHSWAGIGLGTDTASNLIKRISGSRTLSERWRSTSVLIVDESE
jgi:ATP-dependent DNA helicase PIF1